MLIFTYDSFLLYVCWKKIMCDDFDAVKSKTRNITDVFCYTNLFRLNSLVI